MKWLKANAIPYNVQTAAATVSRVVELGPCNHEPEVNSTPRTRQPRKTKAMPPSFITRYLLRQWLLAAGTQPFEKTDAGRIAEADRLRANLAIEKKLPHPTFFWVGLAPR